MSKLTKPAEVQIMFPWLHLHKAVEINWNRSQETSCVTVKSKVSNLWLTDKLVKRKGSSYKCKYRFVRYKCSPAFNTIIYSIHLVLSRLSRWLLMFKANTGMRKTGDFTEFECGWMLMGFSCTAAWGVTCTLDASVSLQTGICCLLGKWAPQH